MTSALVIVQDEKDHEIVRHRRLYGDTKQQQMDWLPYLKQLSLRPRALKYTGIYDLMPPTMKNYLEGCSPTEVGRVLKTLVELTDRTGFESAVNTVSHALSYDAKDADSLENLYRRLYANVPELPPMPLQPGIPKINQMSAHLIAYIPVRFFRTAALVNKLSEAKKGGNLSSFLKKLNKAEVIILDEYGYVPLDRTGAQLLFEIISDCYERKSIILNTNLEFSRWVNVLYDEQMTAAMLDRLLHHCHLLLFPGASNRMRESSLNDLYRSIAVSNKPKDSIQEVVSDDAH